MALLPGIAQAAPPPVGGLTQLPGTAGCISVDGNSEDGTGTCQTAFGIDGPESAVLSPDGKSLYVGSYKNTNQAGLAIFSRDGTTGLLSELSGTSGCFTVDGKSHGTTGACSVARGFGTGDGRDIAITSDGAWAYMVNQQSNTTTDPKPSIMIFQRDTSTGALTQLAGTAGCISFDGSSQDGAGTCQTLPTLRNGNGVTLSSDDRFLYVTDYIGVTPRTHVLSRDTSTGALSEVQCLSRAPAPSGCTAARDQGFAKSLVLAPDGMHAYSADFSHDGISIFDRDTTTGLLTQKASTAGCISQDGKDDSGASTCATARDLNGAETMSISRDGQTLYVGAYDSSALSVFHVNADGTLTQLSGTAGCISLDGNDNTGASTCAVGRALENPYGMTLSPDGRELYVTEFAGAGTEGGVAIFSIDPATGALTQLSGLGGCITTDGKSNGVAGACVAGRALGGAYDPIVSPDGRFAYIAAEGGGQALTLFARETAAPTCQGTAVSTASGAPVTVHLTCTDADGEPVTRSTSAGPAHGTLGPIDQAAGTVTYTPASGFAGQDSITFAGSDGTNMSGPTTAAITVLPARSRAPQLSHVRQSAKRWRRGSRLARISRAHKPPIGTTYSFTLDQPASVRFAFTQRAAGRRVSGRCVKPSKRNAHKRRCTRTVTVATLGFNGHSGRNKVRFEGRLPRNKKLRPGRYTAVITATNAARQRSAPHRLTFTIVR